MMLNRVFPGIARLRTIEGLVRIFYLGIRVVFDPPRRHIFPKETRPSFRPLQFIESMQAAVEKNASGLWQEREQQLAQLSQAAEKIRELISLVEVLLEDKQQLEYMVEDQQYIIEELQAQLEEARSSAALEHNHEKPLNSGLAEESGDDPVTDTVSDKPEQNYEEPLDSGLGEETGDEPDNYPVSDDIPDEQASADSDESTS